MGGGHTNLTYDDYVLFPDDGKRHELIAGEHHVTPAPHARHQRVLLRIAYEIETLLRRTGLGELLIAPTDVVFSRLDVVQPDLLYVSKARAELVDAEARTVKVFRRDGERFGRPQLLAAREQDVLGSPLLPGLAAPLAALFG